MAIEDHTLTHPVMSRLPLAQQEREICGAAAGEAAGLGARPSAHLTVGRLSSYLEPTTAPDGRLQARLAPGRLDEA